MRSRRTRKRTTAGAFWSATALIWLGAFWAPVIGAYATLAATPPGQPFDRLAANAALVYTSALAVGIAAVTCACVLGHALLAVGVRWLYANPVIGRRIAAAALCVAVGWLLAYQWTYWLLRLVRLFANLHPLPDVFTVRIGIGIGLAYLICGAGLLGPRRLVPAAAAALHGRVPLPQIPFVAQPRDAPAPHPISLATPQLVRYPAGPALPDPVAEPDPATLSAPPTHDSATSANPLGQADEALLPAPNQDDAADRVPIRAASSADVAPEELPAYDPSSDQYAFAPLDSTPADEPVEGRDAFSVATPVGAAHWDVGAAPQVPPAAEVDAAAPPAMDPIAEEQPPAELHAPDAQMALAVTTPEEQVRVAPERRDEPILLVLEAEADDVDQVPELDAMSLRDWAPEVPALPAPQAVIEQEAIADVPAAPDTSADSSDLPVVVPVLAVRAPSQVVAPAASGLALPSEPDERRPASPRTIPVLRRGP